MTDDLTLGLPVDPYTQEIDIYAWKLRQSFALSVAVRDPRAHMKLSGITSDEVIHRAVRAEWFDRFAANLRGLVGGWEPYDPRMTWADSWRRRLRLAVARELGRDERSLPSFDFFLRTSSGTPVFLDAKTKADR